MGWTPEQQAAIDARGASVVVSAAAGSGKTSVLVERLIRLLSEEDYPAENMVVVTFTNDAAGEVRARLNRALTAHILEDPENEWLRRQQTMLQSASISTIHSYCLRLLREQFAALDISAGFRVMDDNETKELLTQCTAELMEDLSRRAEENDDEKAGYTLLFEAFCTNHDTPLENLLLSLYTLTEEMPFGNTILAEAAENCRDDSFLQTVLCSLRSEIAEIAALYLPAIEIAERMGAEKAAVTLKEEYNQLHALPAALETADASAAAEALSAVKFGTLRFPNKCDADEKNTAASLRSHAKEQFGKLKDRWLIPLQFAENDLSRHAQILPVLAGIVQELDDRFAAAKRARNGVSFADAMTMALSLLAVREPDGKITKTPLAEQLSQQYCCIMIDEFQDANNQQDLIFRMLSRGGDAEHYGDNLFVVGDSKQCIYRFRNANPENFYRAMRESAPYTQPQLTENTCICLNRNFRSAGEVISVINHVFRMLMTEGVGEITYDDTQELVQGAEYPEARRPVEVMLLPQAGDEPKTEPRAVANRIAWHLSHGTPVLDRSGECRPCEPRDFLLLLRNKTHMEDYANALAEAGIPVCSVERGNYLGTPEMLLLLDILRMIDNPLPEVPVAAAMLSPLFGFTVDELLAVRLYRKNKKLYQAMVQMQEDERGGKSLPPEIPAEKVHTLLDFIKQMQLCAAMDTPEQLIRRIYRQTDFLGLMQMSAGGAQKKANLRALTAYAHSFEENRGGGLSAFLRWIGAVLERRNDLEAGSVPAGTENVVQIKTIHKSKGLEAPFVILADSSSAFSNQDASSVFQFHPAMGIGFQLHDPQTLSKGRTLPWAAVYAQNRREMLSEELRLLYVALTRAREYLILPIAYTDSHRKNVFLVHTNVQKQLGQSDALTRSAGCFADWLIMALARNPACEMLRRELELGCGSDPAQPFLPAAVWSESPEQLSDGEMPQETVAADPVLTAQLASQCAWHYDSRLAGLTAKYGVSELAKHEDVRDTLRRPHFITDAHGLTGTERGTAVHLFMQYADFAAAAQDLPAEIERCRTVGRLTKRQAEAVTKSKIGSFFTSELYSRIANALQVRREEKFMVRLDDLHLSGSLKQLGETYAGTDGMVTGIMDLVFEEADGIVLVDYKTDTGKNAEGLLEEYTEQVRLYAEALSLLMDKPVTGCYLYSVPMQKTVPVSL